MNEIKLSSYSKTQSFTYFAGFLGKNISSSDSVDKKIRRMYVKSDLDLHCAQKVRMSRLAVKV